MIPPANADGAPTASRDSDYVPLKITSTATLDNGGVNEYAILGNLAMGRFCMVFAASSRSKTPEKNGGEEGGSTEFVIRKYLRRDVENKMVASRANQKQGRYRDITLGSHLKKEIRVLRKIESGHRNICKTIEVIDGGAETDVRTHRNICKTIEVIDGGKDTDIYVVLERLPLPSLLHLFECAKGSLYSASPFDLNANTRNSNSSLSPRNQNLIQNGYLNRTSTFSPPPNHRPCHTVLTCRALREVTRQLLSGLKFLHDKKIVHKDIKPDNIGMTKPFPNEAIYEYCWGRGDLFKNVISAKHSGAKSSGFSSGLKANSGLKWSGLGGNKNSFDGGFGVFGKAGINNDKQSRGGGIFGSGLGSASGGSGLGSSGGGGKGVFAERMDVDKGGIFGSDDDDELFSDKKPKAKNTDVDVGNGNASSTVIANGNSTRLLDFDEEGGLARDKPDASPMGDILPECSDSESPTRLQFGLEDRPAEAYKRMRMMSSGEKDGSTNALNVGTNAISVMSVNEREFSKMPKHGIGNSLFGNSPGGPGPSSIGIDGLAGGVAGGLAGKLNKATSIFSNDSGKDEKKRSLDDDEDDDDMGFMIRGNLDNAEAMFNEREEKERRLEAFGKDQEEFYKKRDDSAGGKTKKSKNKKKKRELSREEQMKKRVEETQNELALNPELEAACEEHVARFLSMQDFMGRGDFPVLKIFDFNVSVIADDPDSASRNASQKSNESAAALNKSSNNVVPDSPLGSPLASPLASDDGHGYNSDGSEGILDSDSEGILATDSESSDSPIPMSDSSGGIPMSESESEDDKEGDLKKNESDDNKKNESEDDSKTTSDSTSHSLIANIPSPAKNRFQQASPSVTEPTPPPIQEPPLLIYDAEGTHLFTSPECFTEAKKKGMCGRKRDYYSLGCVLYCLACGMTPFNPGLLTKNTAIFLQLEIQQCNIHFPGWLEMSVGGARERNAGRNDNPNHMMIGGGGGSTSSSAATAGDGKLSGNAIAQDTAELVTLMQNLLSKDPVERVVGTCWGN